MAIWISISTRSESDIQYSWLWGNFAVELVSMRKWGFEAGGTPVGGLKRSAKAFLTRSRHVSRSAGLCGVACSSASIIIVICSRILTITISEDFHLARKDVESILTADLRAAVLQWAWTSLIRPWWGRRPTSDVVKIVDGRQEPSGSSVQSGSSICRVFVLWSKICRLAAIKSLPTIR